MNNERYNQIIDEVYNKYLEFKKENITNTQWDIILDSYIYDVDVPIKPGTVLGHYTGRMCTKEELIEKIRLNKDWSERWGLKIIEDYDLVPQTECCGDVTFTKPVRRYKTYLVYNNKVYQFYE